MKILSIDVGIKNLALVVLTAQKNESKNKDDANDAKDIKDFTIDKWDVINLCNVVPLCVVCKKPAKFYKNDIYYCKQHAKKCEYKIPAICYKKLEKTSLNALCEYAKENGIEYTKPILKRDLLAFIKEQMDATCLDVIETISANNVNLIDLGINLKTEMNKLFFKSDEESVIIDLSTIDAVLLENQISPIANRMKTVQGMIAQYFIDRGNYNIEFMSAANKLKLFVESKKTTYSERKKLSILYTQQLLSKKNMAKELEFFAKHGKKDDLADCLLQGIYYLSL